MVGLGNPGEKYRNTRHNAGFMACQLLVQELGGRLKDVMHKSLYTICPLGELQVLIMLPQTYMNLSGQAVGEMARAFSVPPERIIVVFDDISLPAGRLRVKRSGSDGGHNGVKDIIYHLQSDQFPRIKVGVGAPEEGDLADYVLGEMDDEVRAAIKTVPQAVRALIMDGVDAAMQEFNGKV